MQIVHQIIEPDLVEIKYIENDVPAVEGWYVIFLDNNGKSYDQVGPFYSKDDAERVRNMGDIIP